MKKRYIIIIASLLALALLGGCAGGGAVQESEAAEAPETAAPESLVEGTAIGEELAATYAADDVFSLNCIFSSAFNPYNLTSAWNQVVDMLVYEPLVRIDENFEAQPGLVTAWSTENGSEWTFSVDTTRRFHSGGRVTAYDCVYTLNLASYSERYLSRFEHITEISATDEATFVVKLDIANFRFNALLDIPCIESGSYYDSRPSGTGPYKFSASGDMLLLDSNHPDAESLPLLRIYLKEYTAADDILQAFEDSYIDLVINDPTAMSNLGYSSSNITKYVDTSSMHYLGYNMNSLLFSQVLFRAVMTYAVDRNAIVSTCMGGAAVAAALPIHPNSPTYPKDIAKTLGYSETGLETALEQTGMMDVDGDGFLEIFSGVSALKTEVNFIVCSDSAAKVAAARLIASRLEAAGLAVNLRELSYEGYLTALEEGDFDVYYAEVKLRPDWDLTPLLSADAELNYGGVRDQYLTENMRLFLVTPAEETSAADALYTYIAQQAPITVVCFEKSEVLYHRGVISGLSPTQDNLFSGMSGWTVDLGGSK